MISRHIVEALLLGINYLESDKKQKVRFKP